MPSALYYPHTRLDSSTLLREALLLWDHVDVIVPHRRHSLHSSYDGVEAEARELLLRPRVPSTQEKHAVDARVIELIRDGVPSWLHHPLSHSMGHRYLMYPEKLLHSSIWRLRGANLMEWDAPTGDVAVPPVLGLLLMSMLAEECAGSQLHRITDRPDAYGQVFAMATASLGGILVSGVRPTEVSQDIERLVAVSIQVAGVDRTPLARLVALRKREEKERGIRDLRHKYLDMITENRNALLAPRLTASDRKEITNDFVQSAERELRELKTALGVAKRDLLISKEAITLGVAVAGVVAGGGLGAIAGAAKALSVGALVANLAKYRDARRKAMKASAMAWLFLARPRIKDRVVAR